MKLTCPSRGFPCAPQRSVAARDPHRLAGHQSARSHPPRWRPGTPPSPGPGSRTAQRKTGSTSRPGYCAERVAVPAAATAPHERSGTASSGCLCVGASRPPSAKWKQVDNRPGPGVRVQVVKTGAAPSHSSPESQGRTPRLEKLCQPQHSPTPPQRADCARPACAPSPATGRNSEPQRASLVPTERRSPRGTETNAADPGRIHAASPPSDRRPGDHGSTPRPRRPAARRSRATPTASRSSRSRAPAPPAQRAAWPGPAPVLKQDPRPHRRPAPQSVTDLAKHCQWFSPHRIGEAH